MTTFEFALRIQKIVLTPSSVSQVYTAREAQQNFEVAEVSWKYKPMVWIKEVT